MKNLSKILLINLMLMTGTAQGSGISTDTCTAADINIIDDAQKQKAIKSCSNIANGTFASARSKIEAIKKLTAWNSGGKFISVVKSIANNVRNSLDIRLSAVKLWKGLNTDATGMISTVKAMAEDERNSMNDRIEMAKIWNSIDNGNDKIDITAVLISIIRNLTSLFESKIEASKLLGKMNGEGDAATANTYARIAQYAEDERVKIKAAEKWRGLGGRADDIISIVKPISQNSRDPRAKMEAAQVWKNCRGNLEEIIAVVKGIAENQNQDAYERLPAAKLWSEWETVNKSGSIAVISSIFRDSRTVTDVLLDAAEAWGPLALVEDKSEIVLKLALKVKNWFSAGSANLHRCVQLIIQFSDEKTAIAALNSLKSKNHFNNQIQTDKMIKEIEEGRFRKSS